MVELTCNRGARRSIAPVRCATTFCSTYKAPALATTMRYFAIRVRAATRASRRGELIDDGVGVTLICPAPVDTEFDDRPDDAPGVMSVAECARLTIRALDRRRREEIMTFRAKVATLMRPFAAGLTDAYIRKRLDAFYRT